MPTPRLTAALAALLFALPALLPAAEVPLGDDGLHKPDWLQDTFRDLREDLAEANAEGRRLLLMVEQRGCIYCAEMHEEVFPDPGIDARLRERFFVVQINMFGQTEVTDFDGTVLGEKDMVRRWGLAFTPTLIFLPEEVPDGATAVSAAAVVMPGAFGRATTRALMDWVLEHGYASGELFQEYLARQPQ
ncbi:thioredoxin family protein [Poseidonocella sp. HB161398]|uniref:SoxW family protein n=1 Tax=Poseidonocella sp. HB161398 TaxID=2320855 RepID=UPI001107C4B3|nr:thioredoxin family protein [Poseidonocella sp. HB161398]